IKSGAIAPYAALIAGEGFAQAAEGAGALLGFAPQPGGLGRDDGDLGLLGVLGRGERRLAGWRLPLFLQAAQALEQRRAAVGAEVGRQPRRWQQRLAAHEGYGRFLLVGGSGSVGGRARGALDIGRALAGGGSHGCR